MKALVALGFVSGGTILGWLLHSMLHRQIVEEAVELAHNLDDENKRLVGELREQRRLALVSQKAASR